MENNIQNRYTPIKTGQDKNILIITISLIVIGFMAVLSASLPYCISHNMFPLFFIGQHIFWLLIGSFGLWWFSRYDYKKLKRYAFPLIFLVIILLLVVKYTPMGVTINGARRWINLGICKFQPSELSKLGVIMLLANLFSYKKEVFLSKLPKYLTALVLTLFVILKQPNLSMTIILLAITVIMYICAGKSLKPIFVGGLVIVGLAGMVATNMIDLSNYLEPHQMDRVLQYRTGISSDVQGGGYQVYHSRIAIASGGLIGCGYGNSKEKQGWLPEAHTDFIFSVISEEVGFIGGLFVILLFLMLFYRGIQTGLRCPTTYGRLLALGITFSITIQAFFNISVATAFLPATGITLPFISYGGSSLLVSMCMIGILLNISENKLVRTERSEYEK